MPPSSALIPRSLSDLRRSARVSSSRVSHNCPACCACTQCCVASSDFVVRRVRLRSWLSGSVVVGLVIRTDRDPCSHLEVRLQTHSHKLHLLACFWQNFSLHSVCRQCSWNSAPCTASETASPGVRTGRSSAFFHAGIRCWHPPMDCLEHCSAWLRFQLVMRLLFSCYG